MGLRNKRPSHSINNDKLLFSHLYTTSIIFNVSCNTLWNSNLELILGFNKPLIEKKIKNITRMCLLFLVDSPAKNSIGWDTDILQVRSKPEAIRGLTLSPFMFNCKFTPRGICTSTSSSTNLAQRRKQLLAQIQCMY